jgi:hypothetical protein
LLGTRKNANVETARSRWGGLRVPRKLVRVALMGLFAWTATGCVGVVYAVKANSAASNLEEAKTLGADETAEYEYYYAKAYLEKAMELAAEAEYGDAIEFAGIADETAEKAVELAREAHRSAGR